MRNNSFWVTDLSLIDKLFFLLRKFQLRNINFNNKIVVDFGSWYNANFLQYLRSITNDNRLIAFDLKLNKDLLKKKWIDSIEGNLNNKIIIKENIDVAICTAVLEHLEKPDIFLKNIYNILDEDWIIILTVPSIWAKPVLEFLAYKLHLINEYEIKDHKDYYDKNKLEQIFINAWFQKINIKHSYFELFMNNLIIAKK